MKKLSIFLLATGLMVQIVLAERAPLPDFNTTEEVPQESIIASINGVQSVEDINTLLRSIKESGASSQEIKALRDRLNKPEMNQIKTEFINKMLKQSLRNQRLTTRDLLDMYQTLGLLDPDGEDRAFDEFSTQLVEKVENHIAQKLKVAEFTDEFLDLHELIKSLPDDAHDKETFEEKLQEGIEKFVLDWINERTQSSKHLDQIGELIELLPTKGDPERAIAISKLEKALLQRRLEVAVKERAGANTKKSESQRISEELQAIDSPDELKTFWENELSVEQRGQYAQLVQERFAQLVRGTKVSEATIDLLNRITDMRLIEATGSGEISTVVAEIAALPLTGETKTRLMEHAVKTATVQLRAMTNANPEAFGLPEVAELVQIARYVLDLPIETRSSFAELLEKRAAEIAANPKIAQSDPGKSLLSGLNDIASPIKPSTVSPDVRKSVFAKALEGFKKAFSKVIQTFKNIKIRDVFGSKSNQPFNNQSAELTMYYENPSYRETADAFGQQARTEEVSGEMVEKIKTTENPRERSKSLGGENKPAETSGRRRYTSTEQTDYSRTKTEQQRRQDEQRRQEAQKPEASGRERSGSTERRGTMVE